MSSDVAYRPAPFYSHPWFLVLVGLLLNILAWIGAATISSLPGGIHLVLVLAGTLVSLAGVIKQLREGGWDLRERIESAAVVAAAGVVSLIAGFSMNRDWESGRMLFGALFIFSLLAVALILLPSIGRRIVLSLVILFHFGGMLTAITSVDPPNGTGPWLAKQAWSRVYQPYLSFLYLTNAYHFYSPDPGPPQVHWYHVQYEDGTQRVIQLPDRRSSPIDMHYQRMLALPEHSYAPLGRLPLTNVELTALSAQNKNNPEFRLPDRGSWEEIYQRRQMGTGLRLYSARVNRDGVEKEEPRPIPLVWGMSEYQQYREPADMSKKLFAGLAIRILKTAPLSESGAKPKSVKIYRVIHNLLTPRELADGKDPFDRAKMMPFFMGEFNIKGELLEPRDPFLYWYLPIVYVPGDFPRNAPGIDAGMPNVQFGQARPKDGYLLDSVEMHAAGEITKEKKQ